EDHWAALHHIRRQTNPPPRLQEQTVDWPQFIAKASKARPADAGMIQQPSRFDRKITRGSRYIRFRNGVKASPAAIDLDLLPPCLATVHARPLILSMPLG